MLLFRNLSFRYKIPLRGTVLVITTAALMTASILVWEYGQIRKDLYANAENIGRLLAMHLVTPLRHDDTWRAYEIITTISHEPEMAKGSPFNAELIIVLDNKQQIYVSSRPMRYPMLTPLSQVRPEYRALEMAITEYRGEQPIVREIAGLQTFHLIAPIRMDETTLGYLVIEYPKSLFTPRFLGIVVRAGIATLAVLAVLLPLSWYWGRRMAEPLVQLADCMRMVEHKIPEPDQCNLYESQDEIGLAGRQLRAMLGGLKEKEILKREIMANERLAAIGRLSAGIAHEVNNPLGGMLNAISTYKRHSRSDDQTAARTISLIERGLLQIKQTVGALLVEARLESHALSHQDIDDIHTLILHGAQEKGVELVWENGLEGDVSLPSTQVRQILLNLLLNAIQAAEERGRASCRIAVEDGKFTATITNSGPHITPDRMEHLFEPFAGTSRSGGGHGLGLWVTYQLVRQLDGQIEVESGRGLTHFEVTLPLGAI